MTPPCPHAYSSLVFQFHSMSSGGRATPPVPPEPPPAVVRCMGGAALATRLIMKPLSMATEYRPLPAGGCGGRGKGVTMKLHTEEGEGNVNYTFRGGEGA